VGGYAYFRSLTDAKGLSALKTVGGYADFRSLTDAKGLSALKTVGGHGLWLNDGKGWRKFPQGE
jgi:hypothetical protein